MSRERTGPPGGNFDKEFKLIAIRAQQEQREYK